MTKYLHDLPFSSKVATDEYRANWDAIFGRKAKEAKSKAPGDDCPCGSAKAFTQCHGSDPSGE